MEFTIYDYSLIFFNMVDVYLYYHLLNNKLTYRFPQKMLIPTGIISYILWTLSAFADGYSPDIPLKMPLLLLFFINLFFNYKDTAYKRIIWIVVSFFSIIVCELLATPIVLLLTHTNFSSITNYPHVQILGTILARLLQLLIVSLLVHTKKRILDTFTKDFFLIILVDVVYVIIITNFFYFDNIYMTIDMAITLSFFVMFIISLLTLYLLRKITKKSDEIMTTNLKLQQIEMEHKQNQDMAIVVEDLRALRHDMNNHMGILQGLLSAQAYDDATAYLATITKELTVANSFTFTENKVLSVLLNNKSSKARQLNITFDTEILSSTTPFSDRDLCAVIGNILENAIEASSNHTNPYIYFSMRTQKTDTDKHLVIQCDNTYSVAPIFENGNLITTKENKTYHGIGTKTIRSIAENYGGTVSFTADELFHVTVSVPL